MDRKRFFAIGILALMAIIFFGCGTLPVKPESKSIVVIRIISEQADFDKFYVYYRLYYSKYDYIRIDPTKDKAISLNFEPGEYEIIAIEPVYFQYNRPFKKTATSIKFSCLPNSITIMRNAVKISFEYGEDGFLAEHAELVMLDDSEYSKLMRTIKSDKNAKYWNIVEDN